MEHRRVVQRRWRLGLVVGAVCALVGATGCEISKQTPPSLTGPSELGLSLTVSADSSVLTQDGFSFTRVTVLARDANAQPVPNLALRAEIFVGGALADFGTLSAKTLVTGSDGRGSVVYTAPPPPSQSVDLFTLVTILFTPIEPNFANALPRQLEIRLVPPGVILPPNTAPTAAFTFSQPAEQGTPVVFDASSSTDPDGQIVSYSWDFGDGSTGTGVTASHTYSRGGSFTVILTVTDDRGQSATTTRIVSVTASADPVASFVVSPTSPAVNEQVVFNASGSSAASGRTITRYSWAFGDNSFAEGALATHTYRTTGTFTVVLTVTDDLGNTDTSTRTLIVGAPDQPSASFVTSPSSPAVNEAVQFDASASTPPAGRSIVRYEWRFGDGATASGRVVSHSYSTAGVFTVVLTVTDSIGEQDVATAPVNVGGTLATASFSVSPSSLTGGGGTVTVNASQSQGSPGADIATYTWNFGDSTADETVTTPNHTHTYGPGADGTFTITLTIVDTAGQSASATQSIVISP